MKSEDENYPLSFVLALAAEIYTSTSDPDTVPPPSPYISTTDSFLSPAPKGTLGLMVLHPLTLAQPPLPPRVTTPGGSTATLSSHTGLSVRVLKRQQDRDNLFHFLFVASLTKIPPFVETVVGRLSSITRLHAAKCANIEALLLLNGSAQSPNYI